MFMPTLAAESVVIGAIWSIVGGIAVLAIFFRVANWIERALSKGKAPASLSLKGVLDKTTYVTLHVSGGEKYEDVRVLGYTDATTGKGSFPWELSGMAVLEHRDGSKTVVAAKRIRCIEIPASGETDERPI